MPLDINKDMIIKGIGGSLLAFLFYGHIDGAAAQQILITKLNQVESELDDLWGKYNSGQEMYFNNSIKEMDYKVKQAEKWENYWKDKYKETKK